MKIIKCDYCGSEIRRNASRIKSNKHNFCCSKCRDSYKVKINVENSVGKKYGELTVLGFSNISEHNRTFVECECSCGRKCAKALDHLKSGNTKRCGNCKGETIKERFMSFVEVLSDSQWIWKGSTDTSGYGSFCVNGKNQRAHRVAYELFVGEIPEGMVCMHKDDMRINVSPYNILIGTVAQNNMDCINKNRNNHPIGEACGTSKLKKDDVLEIRRLYSAGIISQKEIGVMFNVSQSNIGDIINRKIWTHI